MNTRFKIKLNLSKKISVISLSKIFVYGKSTNTLSLRISLLFDKNSFRLDIYKPRPFWVPEGIYNWIPNVLVVYVHSSPTLLVCRWLCVFQCALIYSALSQPGRNTIQYAKHGYACMCAVLIWWLCFEFNVFIYSFAEHEPRNRVLLVLLNGNNEKKKKSKCTNLVHKYYPRNDACSWPDGVKWHLKQYYNSTWMLSVDNLFSFVYYNTCSITCNR